MKISSIYPGVWVMVWIKSGVNKENITLCQTPPPLPKKKINCISVLVKYIGKRRNIVL